MKLYTRYNNEELFKMMQSLVPYDVIKGTDFNHWTDASSYLQWVIEKGDDIAVNIDLDCFVTDWSVVEELVRDFKNGEYTHAGIPDAGHLQGRNNTSWVVQNPFFNIFSSSRVLWHYGRTNMKWEDISRMGFKMEWYHQRPSFVSEYVQCMHEPFNGIFNWLYEVGNPMWLQGELHKDGISTIIKYNGKPFALHSWYSREYKCDQVQKKRIDNLYKEACQISQL